jgi:uncharacterized protein (TIGR04222 family)
MNALDLTGPEFLTWYLQWFAVAIAAYIALRLILSRTPFANAPPARELDPFEIAWLRGGPAAVVRAALASLYQRDLIDMVSGVVTWRADEPTTPLPRIEALVLRSAHLGLDASSLANGVADECAAIEARLAQEGLAVGGGQRTALRLIPPLGMTLCMAIGVAKLMVGLSRDRPVGLLVFFLLLSAGLLVWAIGFVPRRTAAGSRLLGELGERHAALRTTMESSAAESVDPSDVAMAVGLWGATLAAPMLAAVFPVRPAWATGDGVYNPSSCGSDGGGSSSCSGGGDGGGGGCGGGGGGGGCGGCGGGH